MSQKVRVRFAPSPTGPLHIGGVRTALFNYLFAKKHGGDFILRIEDTDQTRYVAGAENYIIEALNWLNIPADEGPVSGGAYGPYRQSERKQLYRQYADKLLESGHAYYAFDSAEDLDSKRKQYEEAGETFIYNWHNRMDMVNSLALSNEETDARLQDGHPYVIRFKTPKDETLEMKDSIRGHIKIDTNVLDDKVLFKSDGMPTYHLANIVDDHLMEISHVIRGEEWLPSLALHVLLYRSLGWEAPKFAHLPLIMKPVGKGKLSKRDGDKMGFPVFPLAWETGDGELYSGYREDGYLPEAVLNMLAFLGWNPGTEQEIFNLEELVMAFDLDRVNKAGAKFDPDKTNWFQHHYLQEMDEGILVQQFRKFVQSKAASNLANPSLVEQLDLDLIVAQLKERATFVSDLWEQGSFYFKAPTDYDEKAAKKAFKENTTAVLQKVVELVQATDRFTASNISTAIKGWITANEIGFGKVMMPLRLSLVGAMQGPDVFEIMSILGKDETIARIERAMQSI